MRELETLGVTFDADRHGNLALGLEGGHSVRRIVHAGGAATGRRITRELSARAATHERIQVLEPAAAVALWTHEGRCIGLLARRRDGFELPVLARATVLATGGMAALWERTTNPAGAVGAGLGLAEAAGARLADLEFMQFHPTALRTGGARDGFLITEAIRGEGATLLDAAGERFVDELAPRDHVALAIEAELRRSGERAVGLDLRSIDMTRFPNIAAALEEVGIDPARQPVPVAPAAHYTMGGVATDLDGRSSLPGPLRRGRERVQRAPRRQPARVELARRVLRLRQARRDRGRLRAGRPGHARSGAPAGPAVAAAGVHARRALARRRPPARRGRAPGAARRPLPARPADRGRLPRARGEPRRAPADRPPRDRSGARRDAYAGGRRARTGLGEVGMNQGPELQELFVEAMASLASGVAVITARKPDGQPCGLAATSIVSYSAHPPSLLASISHASRCHDALERSARFGVHILRADEIDLAQEFAGKGDDKFAGVDWRWDEGVPELCGTLAYLRCRRADALRRYDHTILIGDIEHGRLEPGEPLLYARRRMDWLLRLDETE